MPDPIRLPDWPYSDEALTLEPACDAPQAVEPCVFIGRTG